MAGPPVRLSDVTFRWRRDAAPVLVIPELEVGPGEKVFLEGPSGSGKTTLLNLIGGVATAESGRVEVLGQDLGALSRSRRDAFRADHVGFVFQMFNLIPYLSLIENVTLPCRFSARRRRRAREGGLGLEAEARRLLGRMHLDADAFAGRPVYEYSVGQQQRAAAARALIGRPELLIADEPTSSIDADARDAFLDLLFAEAAAAGSTLLFVSHDRSLGPRFDRVLALADVNRAARP